MSEQLQPKKSKLIITSRDLEVFRYLWRWKVLSTRAISKKFFPEANPYSTYIRLTRLHRAGFIMPVPLDNDGMEAWTLTKKSFQRIKSRMVELAVDGYKSENYYHDFITSAFHLGEWLTDQPDGAHTFSEQQLRRIPQDLWPEWVLQSDTHRPDGYSRISRNGHSFNIAFEAELSHKSKNRYERTVVFYDSQISIRFVFWLVGSNGIFNTIRSAFEKYQIRDWSKHHFIKLEDFNKQAWEAKFIEGEFKGKTISSLLGYKTPTQSLHYRYSCSVFELLDSKKRPIQSTASQVAAKSKKA